MTGTRAGPYTWGPHEGDFLGWMRLRFALAKILGQPDLVVTGASPDERAGDRPGSLALCRHGCLERVIAHMRGQGVAMPDLTVGDASWPPSEAVWRLFPAFHDDWPTLWLLWLAEQEFGPGAFSSQDLARKLLDHDRRVLGSPLHGGPVEPPDRRPEIVALEAGPWIQESGDDLTLGPSALDAVTLFRFVVHPGSAPPPEQIRSIPEIRPDASQEGTAAWRG